MVFKCSKDSLAPDGNYYRQEFYSSKVSYYRCHEYNVKQGNWEMMEHMGRDKILVTSVSFYTLCYLESLYVLLLVYQQYVKTFKVT